MGQQSEGGLEFIGMPDLGIPLLTAANSDNMAQIAALTQIFLERAGIAMPPVEAGTLSEGLALVRQNNIAFAAGAALLVNFPDADVRLRSIVAAAIYPEGREKRRSKDRYKYKDGLTGLANAEAFSRAQLRADRDPDVWFVLMDGKHFKPINEYVGEEACDALIRTTAQCIKRAANRFGLGERVFRRGGDEYVVLTGRQYVEAIIGLSRKYLASRLSGDRPFYDRHRVQYETSSYRPYDLGLHAVFGNTFAEADKELKRAKAASRLGIPLDELPLIN